MRIQQSQQDPSPTKLEPNIALLEQLGKRFCAAVAGYLVMCSVHLHVCVNCNNEQ